MMVLGGGAVSYKRGTGVVVVVLADKVCGEFLPERIHPRLGVFGISIRSVPAPGKPITKLPERSHPGLRLLGNTILPVPAAGKPITEEEICRNFSPERSHPHLGLFGISFQPVPAPGKATIFYCYFP